jgi:hypothetical protein
VDPPPTAFTATKIAMIRHMPPIGVQRSRRSRKHLAYVRRARRRIRRDPPCRLDRDAEAPPDNRAQLSTNCDKPPIEARRDAPEFYE